MSTLPNLIQQSLAVLGGNVNSSFSNQLSVLLHQQGINMGQLWKPAIDIIETEKNLQLIMNLSGVSKDSIDVSFFNNTISIKGERMSPKILTETDAIQLQKEIIYGNFERKIVLPLSITQKKSVSITMENGVLIIDIDKSVENLNKFSLKVVDKR